MLKSNTHEIDVVITWVDGKDRGHAKKRAKFMGIEDKGEAFVRSRWVQSDEVIFCLKSIGKFAPWVRRIWIVTDNQSPDMSGLDKSLRDRIEVVDHKVIFQGHEDCLPTFNSVSIEAALHRIPNLAERFIYFNDDFLLLADCKPEDFFVQDGLVLRGEFVHKFVKQGLYTQHRLNAAHLVGAEPGRIFRSAHVCHPVLKSLVEEFYASNPGLFEKNIRFRFRDRSQFLMSTLVEHLAILKGMATIQTQVDYHVITAENCPSGNVKVARRQVARLLMNGNKLGCINNFKNVMGTSPNLLPKLERRLSRRRSNDRLSLETTTWRRVKDFLKRVLRWGK